MAKKKAAAKPKPMTKTEILNALAEKTDLSKKEVDAVLDGLTELIATALKPKEGSFNLPGLLKIIKQFKPARKGGERPDPFNPGQMMTVKPKPAHYVVKVRPLKGLKEMAE